MRIFKPRKCKRVHGLCFTPDGRLLAVGGIEAHGIETAIWLDPATGDQVRAVRFVAEHFRIADDRTRLLIGSDISSRREMPGLVRWLDLREAAGDWHAVPLDGAWRRGIHLVMPHALAPTPDGARLLVGFGRQRIFPGRVSAEWTLHLADCPLEQPGAAVVTDTDSQIVAPAYAPDGASWAASLKIDGRPTVALFDCLGEPPLARFRTTGSRNLAGWLRFTPDGRYLAVLSGRSIHVLTSDRLTLVATLAGHTSQVNAATFSPSGRLLTACHDGSVREWTPATGELTATFDWKIGPLTALAVAPDGLTAAASGVKGQIVVWDMDE